MATPPDLAGRLGLGGLARLLEEATLLVGNDSGSRHLAAAVGTVIVAAHWSVNLSAHGSP
jgi:ADP-heptose:LPS heptosyltransferase